MDLHFVEGVRWAEQGRTAQGAPAKILKGERLGCSLGHSRGDRDRGAMAREGR